MAATRNDNIQDLIVNTTSELLKTVSFSDISLAMIAKQAHISKGTLYYYYPHKDDILFEIIDKYLTQLYEELTIWVNSPKKDTNIRRLLTFVLDRGSGKTFGNLRLYLINEAISGSHSVRQRYIERYRYFQKEIKQLIAERLPAKNAGMLSWVILTLMDGILIQGQLDNPDFNREQFIAFVVDELAQHL